MNEKKNYLVYIVLFGALLLLVGGSYLFGRSHGQTENRAEFESLRADIQASRELNNKTIGELEDYRSRLHTAELTIESLEAGNTILTERLIDDRGTIEEVGDLTREGTRLVEEIRREVRKDQSTP